MAEPRQYSNETFRIVPPRGTPPQARFVDARREASQSAGIPAWGEDLDTFPIDLPIMVIHGQDDLLVPIEVGHLPVEAAPRAELVVIDGGSHMLPITQVAELTERVVSFVHKH